MMSGISSMRRLDCVLILCAALCWGSTILYWAFAPTAPRHSIQLDELTPIGNEHYWPDNDLQIYVRMCIVSLLATMAAAYVVVRRKSFPPQESLDSPMIRAQHKSYWDVAFVLFLFAVLWIPNAELLIEQSFLHERFHHWNFYIMGPLHMYQQGAALGTEAYTQYQSGWIMVFAALGKFTTVDHPLVIQVLSLFTAIYFSAWYLVLRKLGLNVIWGVFCILVCLMLQHFLVFQSKASYTLWVFPSSTILRNPTDVFVLASLLFLFETGKFRYALAAGCCSGLGILFGNDTGIYVVLATLGACTLRLLDRRIERRQTVISSLAIIITAIIVAGLGLTIASRGTVLQANFWSGYFEALSIYKNGFSSIPIQTMIGIEPSRLPWPILFLCTLVIYTVAISRATVLTIAGRASMLEPLYAFIGIVGFGTLILFINRSHPHNLAHVIVPAIVLWFLEFMRFFAGESRSSLLPPAKSINNFGCFAVAICLALMFSRANFRAHPSLLNRWTGNFAGELPSQEYQTQINLLPNLKREIEQRLGGQPYALVGEDTTLWHMAFHQQSPARYLPMLVVTRKQEQTMLEKLDQENLIFCKLPDSNLGDGIRQLIERKYTLVESTPYYDIYRRSMLPPLELKSIPSADTK